MDDFKKNAEYISTLHNKIAELNKEADDLYLEFKKLENASKYMEQLNSVIKKNPMVYDEWLVFLNKGNIEQPEWKADYEPFSISTIQQTHEPVRYRSVYSL